MPKPRISLRTGLLLITLLALWLGWRVHVVRQTEQVIERLQQAGCVLGYRVSKRSSTVTDTHRSPHVARVLLDYASGDLPVMVFLNYDYTCFRADDQLVSEVVEILQDAPWVEGLSLERTRITSASCGVLSSLPQLRHLTLGDTLLGENALDGLAKLKQVEFLGLGGVQLSPESRSELRRRLPDCEIDFDFLLVRAHFR